MVRKVVRLIVFSSLALLAASSVSAQAGQIRHERRPAAVPETAPTSEPTQPTYQYFSVLDGTPKGLTLHHDTEVGTNRPIDVYVYPIELQVLNSDGNLEPLGLIIDNFYTAKAVNPLTAPNPHNARDCATWNAIVMNEEKNQNPKSHTWSYVEFVVAQGARRLQTNEDGDVLWSDDVECWGSKDRFPPF
jgi:hypothetical protein